MFHMADPTIPLGRSDTDPEPSEAPRDEAPFRLGQPQPSAEQPALTRRSAAIAKSPVCLIAGPPTSGKSRFLRVLGEACSRRRAGEPELRLAYDGVMGKMIQEAQIKEE